MLREPSTTVCGEAPRLSMLVEMRMSYCTLHQGSEAVKSHPLGAEVRLPTHAHAAALAGEGSRCRSQAGA